MSRGTFIQQNILNGCNLILSLFNMKIVAICLALLFLALTIANIFEFYQVRNVLTSPLIPDSTIEEVQKPYLVHAIINLAFFLPLLYVAVKRQELAKIKILGTIFLLY